MNSQLNPFAYSELPVAIIGGGFSGTLTAIHLSRRLPDMPVILFEERSEVGPGLAYQTSDSSACLNIPAARMSAFADKPDDFLCFAKSRVVQVSPEDFLPRGLYGEYLKARLEEHTTAHPNLIIDRRRVVDVTGLDESGAARVVLKDQHTVRAALVVLASGNQGSAFSSSVWASQTASAREIRNMELVGSGENVAIVGSGLTMIDAVLELDRRGKAGVIHAISRNGLLPMTYARADTRNVPDLDHLPDSNLRRSVRIFRQVIRDHVEKGGDWRDVFAAVRSSMPSLWQELSPRDRSSFLRRLSPFWEIHRHQCSPEAGARIRELLDSGKLKIHKGTIVSVDTHGKTKRIGLGAKSRDEAVQWIDANHLFDATGPARDISTIGQPLIQNFLRRGFLKPDEHRLGAVTSADYHAIDRGGQPLKWLYLAGPMLRARYFEATAVEELRLHTAAVAARVESEYRRKHGLAMAALGV